MAESNKRQVNKRTRACVDYKQLNSFSSVVLYDTVGKSKRRRREPMYEVERIITRRKVKNDFEYLIKWKGWSLECCSWEPSTNLTEDLIMHYHNPPVAETRLEEASRQFFCTIRSLLKSRRCSLPGYCLMGLDIWRHVTFGKGEVCEHKGHLLFYRDDFEKLNLPEHWWFHLNHDGEGTAVDFPIKGKPVLSWSPRSYTIKDGNVIEAPRLPMEKISLTVICKACNIDTLSS